MILFESNDLIIFSLIIISINFFTIRKDFYFIFDKIGYYIYFDVFQLIVFFCCSLTHCWYNFFCILSYFHYFLFVFFRYILSVLFSILFTVYFYCFSIRFLSYSLFLFFFFFFFFFHPHKMPCINY